MEPQDNQPPEQTKVVNQPPKRPPQALKLVLAALAVLALILGAVLLTSQSQKPNENDTTNNNQPPAVTATAQVTITKDGFTPAIITIKKGTKVTWTNNDDNPHRVASNPHPAHTDLPGLDSKDPPLGPESNYSHTFDKPGTYRYHDHLNPTVNGIVIVE